nr:hypothetical protein [Halococcus saccharolyticus]
MRRGLPIFTERLVPVVADQAERPRHSAVDWILASVVVGKDVREKRAIYLEKDTVQRHAVKSLDVRVLFQFTKHNLDQPPDAVDQPDLQGIKFVVRQCCEINFVVIIVVHDGDFPILPSHRSQFDVLVSDPYLFAIWLFVFEVVDSLHDFVFRIVFERCDEVHIVVLHTSKPTVIDVALIEDENHRVEVLVDLDVAGEDGKRVRFRIIRTSDKRTEWMFHGWIESSGSMQFDSTIFGTNDELVVAGVDDERRSEWKTCGIAADDLAVPKVFEAFASDSGRMVQRTLLKDSGRQVDDRLVGSARGQFREVTLADRFEIGVDIGLLSEIFECVRISDAQPETDFDVFEKINAIRMKTDIVSSGDFLAVDFVEQRGESINDAILCTTAERRSADC